MEKLLLENADRLRHWQTTQAATKGQYAIDRIHAVKADHYPAVLVWSWQEVPHNASDWLEWEMVYPTDIGPAVSEYSQALAIITDWHRDEATDEHEATELAAELLLQLKAAGLEFDSNVPPEISSVKSQVLQIFYDWHNQREVTGNHTAAQYANQLFARLEQAGLYAYPMTPA